ncbi:T7SS effector LXG polymorphic toxin [Enterococcus ureilyticus]|uniref:T7SS effector LXG polymorphic toxin n=1 Tax=Enterococcus ureilyticus TaxID=1131292 RepID=UPI001F5DC07C|nr:T7SS effector LXG polymorphic toxin [Enterococcus ureilyticus]
MPKIDYSEWTELSAEITTQRLKIVSQFKSFNQAQQQFKGTKELTGTGWNSARDYFDGYTTVSDALFNALYEIDEATTEYVSAFTSEVGAAENQLDTEHLERLKSELRSLQAENDILMEAAAKAFENVPFINKFFMERSMLGKAKEIEILEKYQTFEAEHGGDFSEVQIVISSIEQGLAELGNAGNFLGGVEGYKKIVWKDQDWFQKIQDFNEKNKEDRYEIVVIHEDHDGKQFAIYKNGKLDEGRTLDYNKLLGKQDWELLKKLGPETIKMLLNLDDVEVLLDDESTIGQKVKASIMLILAVTPADKVKDVIKAAKLMKRGDHLLDGVKLTAKELDMLRDLEKSGERVKIVEKGKEARKIYNAKGNPDLRALRRPQFDEVLTKGFPNGTKLNPHAYNSLFKSGRKDIMLDDILDALKAKPIPAKAGSLEYINPKTGTSLFVNPKTNEVVGIWPATFKK